MGRSLLPWQWIADQVRNDSRWAAVLGAGKKLEVRGSFRPFGRTQTWVRM
jgi:hypothetical protein